MKKIITTLLLLIGLASGLKAQPGCNITATPNGPAGNSYAFSVSGGWAPNLYLILWNFGDGGWGFGPSTTHSYTMNGTFNVNVSIRLFTDTTNVLCSSNAAVTISGQGPATCGITSYIDSTGTGSAGFFANNVLPGNTISWNFGDGSTGSGSPVSHNYTQTGYYVVTMTTGIPGTTSFCMASDSIYIFINNQAGCDFSYYTNPGGQYGFYPLTPASSGYSYSINFGDGASDSNGNGQFVHTYANSGVYSVSMATTDPNGTTCTSTQNVTVTLGPPPAGCPISYNVTNATGDNYVFTINGMPSYALWTVMQGGNVIDSSMVAASNSFTYTFPSSGTYSISVTAYDTMGVSCTGNLTVNVNSAPPPAGCNINFMGMTAMNQAMFAVPGYPMNATWTVTQNNVIIYTTTTFMSNQFVYGFPAQGVYNISVSTTDSSGATCSSNTGFTYNNTPPPVNFCSASFYTYTQPLTGFFVETSNYNPANTSYFWNFGDGSSSTQRFPFHTYAAGGTYSVTLLISNANCSDTVMQYVYIPSQAMPDSCNAYFVVTQLAPNTLTVVSAAGNNPNNTLTWNFGGVTSNAAFPTLTIPYSSTNIFCLTVTSANCQNSYCDTVSVDSAGVLQRMANTNIQINVITPQTLTGYTVTGVSSREDALVQCVPNPFNGQVSIMNAGQKFSRYRIFSADGKLVDG